VQRFREREDIQPFARCYAIAARTEPTRLLCGNGFSFPMPYHVSLLPNGKRHCSPRPYTEQETRELLRTSVFRVQRSYATPCLEWTRSRDQYGYGVIRYAGKYRKAYRLAWEFANGPVPPGLLVCHHCDNPPCVCVGHLFVSTNLGNCLDAVQKGRVPRGEAHERAKLTDERVRLIRYLYATGYTSFLRLSRIFGVRPWAIEQVVTRQTWKHV